MPDIKPMSARLVCSDGDADSGFPSTPPAPPSTSLTRVMTRALNKLAKPNFESVVDDLLTSLTAYREADGVHASTSMNAPPAGAGDGGYGAAGPAPTAAASSFAAPPTSSASSSSIPSAPPPPSAKTFSALLAQHVYRKAVGEGQFAPLYALLCLSLSTWMGQEGSFVPSLINLLVKPDPKLHAGETVAKGIFAAELFKVSLLPEQIIHVLLRRLLSNPTPTPPPAAAAPSTPVGSPTEVGGGGPGMGSPTTPPGAAAPASASPSPFSTPAMPSPPPSAAPGGGGGGGDFSPNDGGGGGGSSPSATRMVVPPSPALAPPPHDMEAACAVLKLVGSQLDTSSASHLISDYVGRITAVLGRPENAAPYSRRLRFLMQHVIERHRHRWWEPAKEATTTAYTPHRRAPPSRLSFLLTTTVCVRNIDAKCPISHLIAPPQTKPVTTAATPVIVSYDVYEDPSAPAGHKKFAFFRFDTAAAAREWCGQVHGRDCGRYRLQCTVHSSAADG